MQFIRLKVNIVYIFLFLPMMSFAQSFSDEITTHTFLIGTPEQPTIEGGIINVPDKKHEQKNFTNDASDEFSDDQKIKSLLKDAVKDGKLAYVLQRAEQLKLPATVALIPMVESRYQTDAISSKGAVGAWQLMPETAKDYGLESKGRENFIVSTDTALQLLKHLHQQFGNWTLAFAAYNAGNTRLKQFLRDCPHAKKIEELNLPLETKYYVKKLKILRQVMVKLSMHNLKSNSFL